MKTSNGDITFSSGFSEITSDFDLPPAQLARYQTTARIKIADRA